MKIFFKAAMMAAALIAAPLAAQAKNVDIGSISTGYSDTFSRTIANKGSAEDKAFKDNYTFTFSQPAAISGATASFNVIGGIGFESLTTSLYQQVTNAKGKTVWSQVGEVFDATTGYVAFAFSNLTAGVYKLVVSGTVGGGMSGVYGLEVAAVPLPAAGIAFLTAIAGLAMAGRRKRNDSPAV